MLPKWQELARSVVALCLVLTVAGVAAGAILLLRDGGKADDVSKVVQAVFTPLVGLVGTVIGFYFGKSDRS